MTNAYERGMRTRREVLGERHVAGAEARKSELTSSFQHYITESVWGSVWARPDLDRRTRSLVTISILAALGRRDELAMHIRASRRTGAAPEEIAEALLHVAVYAGVPAANTAFEVLQNEIEDTEQP